MKVLTYSPRNPQTQSQLWGSAPRAHPIIKNQCYFFNKSLMCKRQLCMDGLYGHVVFLLGCNPYKNPFNV
ncbi:hypothetical protein EB796_010253 [Bugula neritina]|uniref:Uncharacterized protein n=1 Tax=Bugula neritina TaxID=10212 RepID=A0A7J7K0E7_BUGNE|nr:hypothetical protein EB796_010253 [Bugula neritina]